MTLKQHRLPNGFRIVTEHMPGLASAAIGVWVTAGARHETPTQNGIAHFLEHMAFKGTKRRTALQIAESIEDVGGYINAYTSREVTAYYARVLQNDVPLALDVIADILLNPTLEETEIEVERGVILQEIGQALDTPDDVIFDWLQEEAYPDHPMGRTILGASEGVSAFSRSDLQGFIQQHYGPEQMILSAAGAVDHDEIVKLAENLFGGMDAKPFADVDAARFMGGERRQIKALEQAHFALAFESPGYRDAQIYTAQIYASALGGGMSSRLFERIRDDKGLAYYVGSTRVLGLAGSMFAIYAGTSPEKAEVVIEEINLELDRIRSGAVKDVELERCRTRLKAGRTLGMQTIGSRAMRDAINMIYSLPLDDEAEFQAKLEACDAQSLADFACNYLSPKNQTQLVVMPRKLQAAQLS